MAAGWVYLQEGYLQLRRQQFGACLRNRRSKWLNQSMKRMISGRELFQAQVALFVAIALQLVIWRGNQQLSVGPQYLLIPAEIILAVLIGGLSRVSSKLVFRINHAFVLILIGSISVANVGSLLLVLQSLILGHAEVSGPQLLVSALAVFITNIIVFALWYWEIDSPALTRAKWSKNDQDFLFPQQEMKDKFPGWRSEFLDYLYLSVTNAINFAPAEAKPLTHGAKMLMATQALVSVFTLALVIARSVNILGT